MARQPIVTASPRDIAAIDLDKVLGRLERKLLSPSADPKLYHSSYERNRTSSVLEYARTLLIRLEQDTQRNAPQARKHDSKASLSKQRALLRRLTDRLHEIEQNSEDDKDGIYGPEDGEPLPLPGTATTTNLTMTASSAAASATSIPPPSHHRPPSPTPAGLRNRFAPPSSAAAETPNPTSPFASLATNATKQEDTDATLANRLQNADSERTALTSSLVTLAQQLKRSNLDMQASLTTDQEVVKKAGEGLDKSESGMEAAGKRMGMLKRMSEGQGWWGRMMLYAWIFGLWIVLILLVFAGPKFRF